MNYPELHLKYRMTLVDDELYRQIERKRAFDDFIAELDCSEYDESAITDEQVELILDRYLLYRRSDYAVTDEMEDMRDAVFHVTGLSF